jgi:hypothetical protein
MNTYLAKVNIQAGPYEKKAIRLVNAPNHSHAQHSAIYAEAHEPKRLD